MVLSIDGIVADNRYFYEVIVNGRGTRISAQFSFDAPSTVAMKDAVRSALLNRAPIAIKIDSPEMSIDIIAKVEKFEIVVVNTMRWSADLDFRAKPETVDVRRHNSLTEKRVLTNR